FPVDTFWGVNWHGTSRSTSGSDQQAVGGLLQGCPNRSECGRSTHQHRTVCAGKQTPPAAAPSSAVIRRSGTPSPRIARRVAATTAPSILGRPQSSTTNDG